MSEHINGDDQLKRTFEKISNQAPNAVAYALNGLAYDVRKEVQGKIPGWVKLTRKFLPNSVVYEKATASNLTATVGFDKRANFATLLEKGGTRLPNKKAVAVPIDVKTRTSGGISASNRPAAVMQKKGVFSGVVNGVAGIWQSTKRIPMRLLYVFKKATKYKKHLMHFEETANAVIKASYETKVRDALTRLFRK